MADVDPPDSDPENPYAYTGKPPPPQPPQQPPAPPPAGYPALGGPPTQGPPTQGWPQWQPPPPDEGQQPRKGLWRPAIVGCIATVILLTASILLGIFGNESLYWIGSASGILLTVGFVACLMMLIPGKTRRWAGGLLIGFCVGLAVALVIFAGVCVIAFAAYDPGY